MALTVTIEGASAATMQFGTATFGPLSVTGTIQPKAFSVNLASGNNTITVPDGAVGCLITPPSENAVVLKTKTTSGDTGLTRPAGTGWVELFATPASSLTLYINAASATTGNTSIFFW